MLNISGQAGKSVVVYIRTLHVISSNRMRQSNVTTKKDNFENINLIRF